MFLIIVVILFNTVLFLEQTVYRQELLIFVVYTTVKQICESQNIFHVFLLLFSGEHDRSYQMHLDYNSFNKIKIHHSFAT